MEPKRGGMPDFVPHPDQRSIVAALSAAGFGADQICRAIVNPRTGKAISPTTLYKVFADEMENGRSIVDGIAMGSMVEQMRKGNMTAIIWYTRNRWGWRDAVDHNITARNEDGGEVIIHVGAGKEFERQGEAALAKAKNGKGNGSTQH